MDNCLAPTDLDTDIPRGFSTMPSGLSAADKDVQALQLQQKDAVLQQALTPEALERLKRIKVSTFLPPT